MHHCGWEICLARILLAVGWWVPSIVQAQPAPDARPLEEVLDVVPGATCLTHGALVDHISSWTEASTVGAALRIRVEGSERDPRGVSFWIGQAGSMLAERHFDPAPARCDHLHAMVGLAIALAIKASLRESLVPPPPVSEAREDGPPPASGTTASAAATRHWALGADAFAAWEAVPGLSLGAGLRIERALGSTFWLRLGVLGLGGYNKHLDSTPGHYDISGAAGRLDACTAGDLGSALRLRVCMGVLVGRLHAVGHGFDTSTRATVPWYAVVNGVDLALRLSERWALDLSFSVIMPWERTRLVVLDTEGSVVEGREVARVGTLLALGPVFEF